jgi:hypothetical protein
LSFANVICIGSEKIDTSPKEDSSPLALGKFFSIDKKTTNTEEVVIDPALSSEDDFFINIKKLDNLLYHKSAERELAEQYRMVENLLHLPFSPKIREETRKILSKLEGIKPSEQYRMVENSLHFSSFEKSLTPRKNSEEAWEAFRLSLDAPDYKPIPMTEKVD